MRGLCEYFGDPVQIEFSAASALAVIIHGQDLGPVDWYQSHASRRRYALWSLIASPGGRRVGASLSSARSTSVEVFAFPATDDFVTALFLSLLDRSRSNAKFLADFRRMSDMALRSNFW